MNHLFTAFGRSVSTAGLVLLFSAGVHAGFLDVTSVTPGTAGATFAGSLDGVSVNGVVTSSPGGTLQLNLVGLTPYESSVVDGTSPQYSYSSVYAATTPATDMVGLTKFSSTSPGTLTINFGAPMTNLLLQIANLDRAAWNLSGTAGLTGLTLVSGNGGGGDGLGVSGLSLIDLDSNTAAGVNPNVAPPTAGARSAYGSVLLQGTYSSLVIQVAAAGVGDGTNFTLVTTPEPSSLVLALLGVGLVAAGRRRKQG